MNQIFITGDCHGDFSKIENFLEDTQTTTEDLMIVLGDVKLNYFEDSKDIKKKKKLSRLPITFLFIHGNHEIRPQHISTYKKKNWNNGTVFYEEKYPNLLFAEDGNVFVINNKTFFVCGGAYSVDKYYRLGNGILWCEDEQPDDEIKKKSSLNISRYKNNIDYILTHTCPISVLPRDTFRDEIDQSTVDLTTEIWLEEIKKQISFKNWFCGHYHIDRRSNKLIFVFDDIINI